MFNLTIHLPGGAGGNWLSNLIYHLENNLDTSQQTVGINFHRTSSSPSIELTHQKTHDGVIFYNGEFQFDIYLNVIEKWIFADLTFNKKSNDEQFHRMFTEAVTKLSYLDFDKDLNFDYLFTNPAQFALDLFDKLDQANIKYTKNIDQVLLAIANFRKTCIDPAKYYDNFDTIHWVAWCWGILQRELDEYPASNITLLTAKEQLLSRREFFAEYTKDKMSLVI